MLSLEATVILVLGCEKATRYLAVHLVQRINDTTAILKDVKCVLHHMNHPQA